MCYRPYVGPCVKKSARYAEKLIFGVDVVLDDEICQNRVRDLDLKMTSSVDRAIFQLTSLNFVF